MPHTAGRYQQDLGFTDGRIFAGAGDLAFASSGGSFTLTRIAAGDWSIRAANSTTGNIAINVTQALLRRLGFFEDTQNAFGSTFGSGLGGFKAGPGSAGVGIPGSAQPQFYRPDVIPAMAALQELQPRTALKTKGIKLLSFDCIYTVSSADATTLTCRADQIQYLNGAAIPAPTVVLTSGANGLIKTNGANGIIVNVPIPTPGYVITVDTALWVEFSLVTPGGGTLDFRGFDLAFEFNCN